MKTRYSQAVVYFLTLFERVGGFHPDDDPSDMTNVETGEPTFTPPQVDGLRAALQCIRAAGVDPSDLAMPIVKENGWC